MLLKLRTLEGRFLLLLAFILAPTTNSMARFEAKPQLLDLPQLVRLSESAKDPLLKSLNGNEFQVYRFHSQKLSLQHSKPVFNFLVQGGLHGNETQGSEFVLWLTRRYAKGLSPLNQLPNDQVSIDFIPYANPDGAAGGSRYNARGVNLNRNFGVLYGLTRENPGEASFSEPETRAIKHLFETRRYTAAVDVHGYINWVVVPSAPKAVRGRGVEVTSKQASRYDKWVRVVKNEMRILQGYELKTGAELGDGGAFEDWAFWKAESLAFCLEMETFQRYVTPYRRDLADGSREPENASVDLFQRYEEFIYRMFKHAIDIRHEEAQAHALAGD